MYEAVIISILLQIEVRYFWNIYALTYTWIKIKQLVNKFFIYTFKEQSRNHITLMDPSEHLRPEQVYDGKLQSEFRNFDEDSDDPVKERVRKTYEAMHTNQTVEFVRC